MWCANCQADVAADVSVDHQRIRCAHCGTDINADRSLGISSKTTHARALLERWSSDRIFDPYGPVPGLKTSVNDVNQQPDVTSSEDLAQETTGSPEVPSSEIAEPTDRSHPAESTGRTEPADRAEPVDRTEAADPTDQTDLADSSQADRSEADRSERDPNPAEDPALSPERPARETLPPASVPPVARRIDSAQPLFDAPHADVLSAIVPDRKTNWTALVGQLLAYAGVAGLTVGTVLLLWGYFGGVGSYLPTGWLVSAASQMLLFLGVITLVSGGMEQTSDEVSRGIERLGERMIRIEQVCEEHLLRGPNFSTGRRSETGTPAGTQPASAGQQNGPQ